MVLNTAVIYWENTAKLITFLHATMGATDRQTWKTRPESVSTTQYLTLKSWQIIGSLAFASWWNMRSKTLAPNIIYFHLNTWIYETFWILLQSPLPWTTGLIPERHHLRGPFLAKLGPDCIARTRASRVGAASRSPLDRNCDRLHSWTKPSKSANEGIRPW